jgi:hypothetical protein
VTVTSSAKAPRARRERQCASRRSGQSEVVLALAPDYALRPRR